MGQGEEDAAVVCAPEHHRDQPAAVQPGDRPGMHHPAVAEHGDPVADPVELVEPMRHVQHGGAGGVLGTMAGVLLLGVIQSLINQVGNLTAAFQQVVSGLFLALVVIAQRQLTKVQRT
jgi:hypothetical protein